MTKIRIPLALIFLSLGLAFCVYATAWAASGNAGEAQPSGGGCYNKGMGSLNFYHDTCYGGISWRFYTTSGDYYNTSTDRYTWDGTTYDAGKATVSGCKDTDGYWLLSYERYVPKKEYPYVGSYKNRQYGAAQLKMSAHWSGGYARDASIQGSGFPKLSGKVYTSTRDFKSNGIKDGALGSWDMVEELFDEVPERYTNGHSWNSRDNLSWFCYSPDFGDESKEYTLTAHAVDMSGNTIEYNMDWDKVEEGDYAEVRYYSQGSNYEFVGWKECKKASCDIVKTGKYYGTYLYDNETVYAAFSEKVVTEEPCSDGTETKDRTENGTINISGSTTVSIASSNATKGSDGIYQAKINGDVTVAFDHTVKRDDDGNTHNITEEYGLNNYSGYSSSINSDGSITKANNQTVSVPLTIDDTNKTVCEYVGFQPSTWSFTKTYTDEYSVDGICTYVNGDLESFTKTGESLISRGTTPSYSVPTSNGNNGQSSNTCVSIHRPWNFKIASIKPQATNGVVYSGSTLTANDLKFDISVEKNNNSYLITDIPQAEFTLTAVLKDKKGSHDLGSISIPGQHKIAPDGVTVDKGNYNYHANLQNYKATFAIINATINVPDTTAGNQLCLKLAINRNNSGNGYASNFSGSTTSSEVCYTIAKHPTFQVWGGNFYTAGKVDAYDFAATKNNVNGDNSRPYSFASANNNNNNNAISFNPWVELAVVAGNGNIKGLSSGAATAYSWNGNTAMQAKDDNTKNSFCTDHSPLSIASGCASDTLQAASLVPSSIKELFYNRYIANNSAILKTDTISSTILESQQVAYNEEGTITINGDIKYGNKEYSNLSEIPVYIIYAKNINIACSVGQIDAILIADGGAINTCSDIEDENAEGRSVQLAINGLVIADKLILGRTYGAAYGQNSNVPAEIFDLSPMFYLWSGNETGKDNSRLYTTYLRELAPRY